MYRTVERDFVPGRIYALAKDVITPKEETLAGQNFSDEEYTAAKQIVAGTPVRFVKVNADGTRTVKDAHGLEFVVSDEELSKDEIKSAPSISRRRLAKFLLFLDFAWDFCRKMFVLFVVAFTIVAALDCIWLFIAKGFPYGFVVSVLLLAVTGGLVAVMRLWLDVKLNWHEPCDLVYVHDAALQELDSLLNGSQPVVPVPDIEEG